MDLLPHLADVCRRARQLADKEVIAVAASAGYKEPGAIRRFEVAKAWPGRTSSPDKVVNAYSEVTGVPTRVLWQIALARSAAQESSTPKQVNAAMARAVEDGLRAAWPTEQPADAENPKAAAAAARNRARKRGRGARGRKPAAGS